MPAVVSVMQCALILLAPIEPLFTHAGHVYVDPSLAAGAKAKAALATMHIDSDSDSEADTVCAASHAASRLPLLAGSVVDCARYAVACMSTSIIVARRPARCLIVVSMSFSRTRRMRSPLVGSVLPASAPPLPWCRPQGPWG